eukprot:PITA_35882
MSNKKKYILVCTDYVTKWVEAKALYAATEKAVVEFLFEDIFTRFGVPREIVTHQGTQFTSKLVKELTEQYQVKHRKSTPYHPQDNGQVESTNKVLESILTKTIHLHQRYWAEKLPEALWDYRVTWRNVTRHTPYEVVYGKKVLLPIEFQVKTFRTTIQLGMNLNDAQEKRLMQSNELDEIRQDAYHRYALVQNQRARWHDKFIKKKVFHPSDWALLYDSKFKHFKGGPPHSPCRIKEEFTRIRFIPLTRLGGLHMEKELLESPLEAFKLSKYEAPKQWLIQARK